MTFGTYYNDIKIKEFNDYNKHRILVDSKKYKAGDRITVKYFDDTPCRDCPIFLFVELGKKDFLVNAVGEGNPLSFDVEDLIEFHKMMKTIVINVYYAGSYHGKQEQRKKLFEIEII